MTPRAHVPSTAARPSPAASGRGASAGKRRARDRALGHRERGAVLIVALLLSALIALGLGSYLRLNLSSSRLANRSFKGYAALNLAEAGVEEAVWSFNQAQKGQSSAWAGWTRNGSAAWQKFSNFNLGQNTSSWVKVYVDNTTPPATARPKIIAQSTIGSPDDTATMKMLELTLRRRSFFAGGIVAKESVAFSGSVTSVDSWNSDPDRDPATPPVDYSASVRTDRGTVASAAVVNTAVLINQADVWGFVATGGAQPQVGANGSIRGPNTPEDVKIDPQRISTDFNADFSPVLLPDGGIPLFGVGPTLGIPGLATKWRTPGIVLSGNSTLTILGDVTLVLTSGAGAQAISLTGNASLVIPPGSSLTVYTAGDVKLAGNGVTNRNIQPASFQLFGTSPSPAGQDIDVLGNGALRAAIYAPNGHVRITGNGDVMGSLVARTITFVGNAAFHYDESLAERDANQPFTIAKWRELTTAESRAPYLSLFNGW